MRAKMSDRDARQAPYRYMTTAENAMRAMTEAQRILGETETGATTQGVASRHYPLDGLGLAGKALAEALAAFVAD